MKPENLPGGQPPPDATSGETDLARLLASMRPSMSDAPYVFATAHSLDEVAPSIRVIGTFTEDEGVTIIALFDDVSQTALVQSAPFARISLSVHSSLAAVGLSAAIATALAQEGISANIVAGFFHDHVFVPWETRHAALEILRSLSPSTGG